MELPRVLRLRVHAPSETDLSGLIVQLTVQAGRKNPYRIRFPLTNESGQSELTRDDFIGQFKDHWEEGLMDYDGSINTASPVVEVSLYDPTWSIENRELEMAWPLLKHERTKWFSREQEYLDRVSCRNSTFTADQILINLEHTSDVDLVVRPRLAAQGGSLVSWLRGILHRRFWARSAQRGH